MDQSIDQKTPARAWGMLAISYIASWAAALNKKQDALMAEWEGEIKAAREPERVSE